MEMKLSCEQEKKKYSKSSHRPRVECIFVFRKVFRHQVVNEHWWPIEIRSAAFDHSYYTVALNRVGIEKITLNSGVEKVFGPCFGSTFITAPDGSRTKFVSHPRWNVIC